MSSGLRLLSNYYRLDTITAILGMAIERSWSVYFRNRKSQQYQCLTVEQLLVIRKDQKIYIPLEVTPIFHHPFGGYSRGLAEHQQVNTIDLFVEESTLILN